MDEEFNRRRAWSIIVIIILLGCGGPMTDAAGTEVVRVVEEKRKAEIVSEAVEKTEYLLNLAWDHPSGPMPRLSERYIYSFPAEECWSLVQKELSLSGHSYEIGVEQFWTMKELERDVAQVALKVSFSNSAVILFYYQGALVECAYKQ